MEYGSGKQPKEKQMTLALRNQPNQLPTPHELMVYETMAKQAVASKMYKGIGDENGVMMIMLAAREFNLPVMASLNGGLNIINGKVEISARMMCAMIRRAGHNLKIEESTDEICTISGKRIDNGDVAKASFSVADAHKAGLFKPNGGWGKYPKDMCFARALSRLARQLFADVIGTGYVEGEIQGASYVYQPEAECVEKEVVAENVLVDSDGLLSRFLEMFSQEEKTQACKYVETVQDHFKWSVEQTLKELMVDPAKLREKFDVWKAKQVSAG